MATLWNATDRSAVIKRIQKLNDSRPSRWGKMNATQMTTHLIETFKITFDEKPVKVIPGKNPPKLMRWLIVFSPIPWPKGTLATTKEYLDPSCDESLMDEYKEELVAYLKRFAQAPEKVQWGKHALFNELTAEEWGALMYKHTDHHLRQFGC
ncbi:MAG: hypothetical protein ACYDBB_07800 [Armatimonadota bacterium]